MYFFKETEVCFLREQFYKKKIEMYFLREQFCEKNGNIFEGAILKMYF